MYLYVDTHENVHRYKIDIHHLGNTFKVGNFLKLFVRLEHIGIMYVYYI